MCKQILRRHECSRYRKHADCAAQLLRSGVCTCASVMSLRMRKRRLITVQGLRLRKRRLGTVQSLRMRNCPESAHAQAPLR
jgi:hypothetical protein